MEKSLVENKPTDPNAEPNENYENLPFHGMQNPPTKVSPCLHNIIFRSFSLFFSFMLLLFFFPQKPANVLFNANCCCHFLCLLLLLLFISTLFLSHFVSLFFFVPTQMLVFLNILISFLQE